MSSSNVSHSGAHRSGSGEDLVDRFLSTYDNRQTRRNYRTDLRQFFGEESVTRQKASRVREGDLTDVLKERAGSLKRTTLERKIESIRSFFRWLAEQDLIEETPLDTSVDTRDLIERVLEENPSEEESSSIA